MNVQLLSIQSYEGEQSYEIMLLLGRKRSTFIVTIRGTGILAINGDEEFKEAFRRDVRLAGIILRLVGDFYSGGSVELPIDLGEWEL
jgi:hypothetical protein